MYVCMYTVVIIFHAYLVILVIMYLTYCIYVVHFSAAKFSA